MGGKRYYEKETDHGTSHRDNRNQRTISKAGPSPAIGEAGNYDNHTSWNSVEETLLRRVSKANDKLAEESCEATVGDIGEDAVEEKCPGERVKEGFAKLIPFEMLVTDSLAVLANSLDGKEAITFV